MVTKTGSTVHVFELYPWLLHVYDKVPIYFLYAWYLCSRKTCLLQAQFFDTFWWSDDFHKKMAIAAGEPGLPGYVLVVFLVYIHVYLDLRLQYNVVPSQRTLTRKDSPLERILILTCMQVPWMHVDSLSPKDTSVIRTELFLQKGAPIRGGLLYMVWVETNIKCILTTCILELLRSLAKIYKQRNIW